MRYCKSFMIPEAVVVLILMAGVAGGDTIRMKNGDRLTGTITTATDGVVVFDSTVAGVVRVSVDDIACMETDREITVSRVNGVMFTGWIECLTDGRVQIISPAEETGEPPVPVEQLEIRNISGMKAAEPEKGFVHNGNIAAGGVQSHGNESSKAWNASVRLLSRYARHRLGLEGKYNYGKSGGEVTAEDYLAGAKYDYFLTKRLFSYIQGLYEKDNVAELDRRLTSGVGLGYQFIDTPRHQLSVEAGISHVNEHNGEAPNRDYEAARWAVRLGSVLVADRLNFFHYHEGYDRLDDSDTLLLRSEQGLRLKVDRKSVV